MGIALTVQIGPTTPEWALTEFALAGQLDLVVAVPVGSGMADGLPPGVHLNADGSVATVVFEGAEPDPAVLAALNERLPPWGLAVTAHP